MRRRPRWFVFALVLVAAACGSGDTTNPSGTGPPPTGTSRAPDTTPPTSAASGITTATAAPGSTVTTAAGCADVISVDVTVDGGRFAFATTVRSDETGWDKYADWWEVRDGEGNVIGVRELAHPHETEQPFTRSLSGVEIPGPVVEVVVIAHDSVLGFCGASMTVALPSR